jgi:uncharacterized protein YdeI (YjbR/CyaY-like superfamily)
MIQTHAMGTKDKRVDAYIQKAQPFAQPVLQHLRDVVHKACPDVEEKIKWSFPHFDYKGQMMCSMAAFKQHCAVNFWKAALMKDKTLVENARSEVAMGHLGRITSLKDLPSDKVLARYIKEAMKLNDEGVKLPAKAKASSSPVTVPTELLAALKRNKAARETFEAFSNSHKKEYVQWITEAKTDATREKRIGEAIEMLAEGKRKNWKYEVKK